MKPISVMFLLLTAFFSIPSSTHALTLGDIEGEIMCICKDNCGKVLASCTCDKADVHRKDIYKMISDGKNKPEIIGDFIKRYGEKVLASPTKTGFNLSAWIVPFLAIFLGGWGINRVIRSWSKKKDAGALENKPDNEERKPELEKNPYKKLMEDELKDFD